MKANTPSWVPCRGEAHSNAHVDGCSVCTPHWGEYPTCVTCCNDEGYPLTLRRKPRSRAATVGCERCGKRYDLGTGIRDPLLWRYIGLDRWGQSIDFDAPATDADGLTMRAEAGITHVVVRAVSLVGPDPMDRTFPIHELLRDMTSR